MMLMLFSYIKNKLGIKPNYLKDVTQNKKVSFLLSFQDKEIGTLSFDGENWIFEYSTWFKNQNQILPLLEFPNKESKYKSNNLWSFFLSRIPSAINMKKKEYKPQLNSKENLADLLKKFGQQTINNPFVLKPI